MLMEIVREMTLFSEGEMYPRSPWMEIKDQPDFQFAAHPVRGSSAGPSTVSNPPRFLLSKYQDPFPPYKPSFAPLSFVEFLSSNHTCLNHV